MCSSQLACDDGATHTTTILSVMGDDITDVVKKS